MLIQGVDTVLVFVTDVDLSVAWYTEVLELPLQARRGDFAVFDAGNIRLAIHGGAQPGGPERNSGSMPVFRVGEYTAAKETLESRGCQFVFENRSAEAVFGTFLDPDANPLQIMQRI